MNPTANSFIKLAIVISFSLQACTAKSFGHSSAMENIEQELNSLHLARRQLERPGTNEATQVNGGGREVGNNREKGASNGEELAGNIFEALSAMGGGLETLTSLASSKDEILENSKAVRGMVPQFNSFAKNLLATAPAAKSDELNKSLSSSNEASESLIKSLKAIEQNPEDANLIKENYKTLEKSFQVMLTASEDVAIATVPKIAELVKSEQQAEAAEREQESNGRSN